MTLCLQAAHRDGGSKRDGVDVGRGTRDDRGDILPPSRIVQILRSGVGLSGRSLDREKSRSAGPAWPRSPSRRSRAATSASDSAARLVALREDRVGIGVFQPFPPADGPGGDGVDVERSSGEDGDRVFWAQRLA